jgi:DNA-binding NarL/FixJ family response regulator
MSDIRVLIVDDHAILRDGIRSLLERQADIQVVAEASNGREALEKVREFKPDIVLMDVAMPEMNGLEATRMIRSEYPQVRVLILTQHDNREYVAPLLQAGASGYVLKRSGGREVVDAIHQVYNAGAYLEASITRQMLEGFASPPDEVRYTPAHLTIRERQVLELLVDGKSNKEIALLLGISPKTVSVHRSSLMLKLNVRTSIELLRYVNDHHILE